MTRLGRALITGASGAIGQAISLSLAEQGYEVWLGCRSRVEETTKLRDTILSRGGAAEVLALDITDYESCNGKISVLINEHGPVSAFVHCAGIVHHQLLMLTKPDDWNAVLATNLSGFYHVSRAILRGMIQQHRGCIVAIGSVVANRGLAGQAVYSASKAGLLGAVRSLAQEVGSYNIRVNVVSPGWIDAGMNSQRSIDKILPRIPLQRAGSPEEVASLVSFLCSPGASYVTGARDSCVRRVGCVGIIARQQQSCTSN